MRFEIFILIALVAIVSAQSSKKKPVVDAPKVDDSRSFVSGLNFTTFTLIKWTRTSTSTLTSTITCTTSTSALTTCTAGRRRRGLLYDAGESVGKNRRGLFYNEADEHFLPKREANDDPVEEIQPAKKADNNELIPLEIQSGFTLPEGAPSNRFFLTFGTSTIFSYTITSSTFTLVASCSSVTNYPSCGSGK